MTSKVEGAARPDGKAYIDLDHEANAVPIAGQFADADSQEGSSVELSDDEQGPPNWDGGNNEVLLSGEEDIDPFDDSEGSLEEDLSDLDIQDWSSARGDFTKQFNKVKQYHDAVRPSAGQTSTSRPPVPATNSGNKQDGGKAKIGLPNVARGGDTERQTKDKSDRATQDQVLDDRTRLVLAGLVNRSVMGKIEWCISSGKEANVYYASSVSPTATATAVKIYRTSILKFKARQNYIVGEHRFQGEYSSSRNARKMIRVWAEKELRNLKRLQNGGIRSPKVVEGKGNVLVLEFLGIGETPAPRLKDATIPADQLQRLYFECIIILRTMFQVCHLVHADFSEYNILYHESHLWVIDVSQSVEHDHPRSMDFLRKDISNATQWFGRESAGEVKMLRIRRAWEFVVSEHLSNGSSTSEPLNVEQLVDVLRNWVEEDAQQANREGADAAAEAEIDDGVFMSTFIPRHLGEITNPENDQIQTDGQTVVLSEVKMSKVGGDPKSASRTQDATSATAGSVSESAAEDELSSDEDEMDQAPGADSNQKGFKHEDKESKKERKKAVKEENRIRRMNKMSKVEKQKLMKKKKQG